VNCVLLKTHYKDRDDAVIEEQGDIGWGEKQSKYANAALHNGNKAEKQQRRKRTRNSVEVWQG
jgi:hypothetical protein